MMTKPDTHTAATAASKTAHTPGPWLVEWGSRTGRPIGIHSASKNIVTMLARNASAEAPANARLIAAAPELLEALQRLTDWADSNVADPALTVVLGDARAAIAKATGEAA